jgi:DNA-directed RNA polymerase specialized sigma24 family protein
MHVYRVRPDEAGDFYVFAFDGGRIYRRLRTYEGRAPFRAYLLGYVLDDLVLEWKRTVRTLDTVSIDDVDEIADPASVTGAAGAADEDTEYAWLSKGLSGLEPLRATVLKLLYIEDWDLSAREIRALAETSGRSIAEVVGRVEELRATVREREARLKQLEDSLAAVQAWMQLYERRLRRLEGEMAARPTADLVTERTELERKLERRRQQRSKLLGRAKRRKVTAPYKDIAALFNTTVGNIGSYIARARQELRQRGLALQG